MEQARITETASLLPFMRLMYSGGRQSHPHNQRHEVKDDTCNGLFNLVREIERESRLPVETVFEAEIIKAFGVIPSQMVEHKCRKRELVWARQLHMYVRCKLYRMSLASSAAHYNKDHATALHAIRTVTNLMETDFEYRVKTEPVWKLWAKCAPLPRDVAGYVNK